MCAAPRWKRGSLNTSDLGLEARGLRVERGDNVVLNGLSFTALPGSITHLKGDNGSGKTTLLRTLAGLIQADAGEVMWQGTPVRNQSVIASKLNFIGHQPGLNAELTARENLEFIAALSAARQSVDVSAALARLNATGIANRQVRHLSAGQRQRIALARLVLFEAELWMLDEPFSALDTHMRHVVEELMEEHLERGGITLIVTHQAFDLRRGMEELTLGGPR